MPMFAQAYRSYADHLGKEPTVYHYWLKGDLRAVLVAQRGFGLGRDAVNELEPNAKRAGITVDTFDLTEHETDYYSLPNLVATMRVNRFSLADEVMATPLLTVADALKPERAGRI